MQSLFGWAGKVLRVSQFTSTFEQLLFSPEKYTLKEFEIINRKYEIVFQASRMKWIQKTSETMKREMTFMPAIKCKFAYFCQFLFLFYSIHLSRNSGHVRPANIHISLRIRADQNFPWAHVG